eukprot:XP_001703072.1 predicted protein [Chlamydomonas reinhardtii]
MEPGAVAGLAIGVLLAVVALPALLLLCGQRQREAIKAHQRQQLAVTVAVAKSTQGGGGGKGSVAMEREEVIKMVLRQPSTMVSHEIGVDSQPRMLAGPQAQPVDIHRKMPISKGRASLDSAPVGSIEQALLTLKLSAKDPDVVSRLDKVLYTLRDVVSGPNIMMCEDQEALWWEAFAEVFASERRLPATDWGIARRSFAPAYIGHSLQQAGRSVKDGLGSIKDGLERAGLQTVQHMQEHGPHVSSPAKKEKPAKDARLGGSFEQPSALEEMYQRGLAGAPGLADNHVALCSGAYPDQCRCGGSGRSTQPFL